jgi:hypothetical protein
MLRLLQVQGREAAGTALCCHFYLMLAWNCEILSVTDGRNRAEQSRARGGVLMAVALCCCFWLRMGDAEARSSLQLGSWRLVPLNLASAA